MTSHPLRALMTSVLLALMVMIGCGTDSPSSPNPVGKHLGERCEKTEECASSLCVRVDEDGGICSRACSDDSGCPRGDNWGCVPAPEQSFSVCACVRLADAELCGDGLDNDCNGAADDCRYCDGQRVANDDHEHCGACGNACRADQACRSGVCECEDSASTECDGSCVQLPLDAQNCGECGRRCGTDQSCQSGECACPAGQESCGDLGCFDLQNDADHCGACDGVCTEGRVCQSGSCACPDASRADYCPGLGCIDLKTNAKHCGACDEACPDGQSCVDGACACAAGRTVCDGACKDTNTDPENCGECENACPAPLACIEGECGCTGSGYSICGERCASLQTDTKNCGTCGNTCASGETCSSGKCQCPSGLSCDGVCVPTSDDRNCGACGNACPTGQRCSGNSCVCEGAGLTRCGDDCLDLSTDEQSCGTCDKACNAGERCNFGACQCPYATTYCSAAKDCIPLASDEQNCGACGKECNPTEVCTSGACSCPVYGQVYCAALGACVDVQSSADHCGACATKCKATEICQYGFCDCPSYTEQYCTSQKACTDTYSNDQHCGACDRACPAGTHCTYGACTCAAGQTLCADDKCYDLSANAAHCGTCDNACATGQVCRAGKCGCPSPSVGKEVRLTSTVAWESAPSLAFNGTNVGVLYLQSAKAPAPANLRFALVKTDGTSISDVALTSFTNPNTGDAVLLGSSLTWTGTEFGLVYLRQKGLDTQQVLLQRLNANGTSKGAAVVVSTETLLYGPSAVAVAWSTSYGGYAVTYRTQAGRVFRRVGATGATPESESLLPSSTASAHSVQLVAAPDGTWGLNALGELVWFNADGSRTLPEMVLMGDVTLSHDGAAWLATAEDNGDNLTVQRGTSTNQGLIWSPELFQRFNEHTSTLVGKNLAVLAATEKTSLGPMTLLFQRFVVPAGTSTALTTPTPPIDTLPGLTAAGSGTERPHNFALVATGASTLLSVWADVRWGATELYSVPITIPACP